jgi:PPM family protein phosphatase
MSYTGTIRFAMARISALLWPPRFHAEAAVLTDVGCKRKHNEDAILDASDVGLLCVADGMGGAAGGEIASQCIVETIAEHCETARTSGGTVGEVLAEAAICEANARVHQLACDGDAQGMGSTVVVLLTGACDGRGHVLHVGDSRAYHFRHRELRQVTTDHTLAQAAGLEDGDVPSIIEGRLTCAIGLDQNVEVEVTHVDICDGDLFVLCSDGLNRHVTDDEMEQWLITNHEMTLADTARSWTELAKERGGKDNISVALARIRSNPIASRLAVFRVLSVCLVALLLVGGGLGVSFHVRRNAIKLQRQRVVSQLGELSQAMAPVLLDAIIGGSETLPPSRSAHTLDQQGIECIRQAEEYVSGLVGWRKQTARTTLNRIGIQLLRSHAAAVVDALNSNRADVLKALQSGVLETDLFPPEVRDSIPTFDGLVRFSRSTGALDSWFLQLERTVEYGRLTALPRVARKYAGLVEGVAPDCALSRIAAMDLSGLDTRQAATYLEENWPFGDTRPDLLRRVDELSRPPR